MIPVEKFLDEQEKKDVFLFIYCYYDKVLKQFNTPMVEDHDPDFMATSVRSGLIKGTFPADKAAGLQLVFLGKFNINTGDFDILENGQIIIDCDKFLKKEEALN